MFAGTIMFTRSSGKFKYSTRSQKFKAHIQGGQKSAKTVYAYIAKDITNPNIIKLGSSTDPRRRIKDTNFGKAPTSIKESIKNIDNRRLLAIFKPSVDAVYNGDQLERRFHSINDEHAVRREWYNVDILPKIINFFGKHNFIYQRLRF